MRSFCLLLLAITTLISCNNSAEKKTADVARPAIALPVFNGDSAYHFVKQQVELGPRVPGTRPHILAGDLLITALRSYGAVITTQHFDAETYDGTKLKLRNIIGSFNPEKQKRILLAAHWDTRPFADKDPEKKNAAFDGANDGASGVAILLEMARMLHLQTPNAGVDIIFFDGEDWGERESDQGKVAPPPNLDSWWCLGSQYWAKHKHKSNYTAYYGILLDMAGARDAHFYREGISMKYAPRVVDRVWQAAASLGYGSQFVPQDQPSIQDDHVFVNAYAGVPMIDIVDYQPGVGYFGSYHHSRTDNIDIISKETLAAVGRVLVKVIYAED